MNFNLGNYYADVTKTHEYKTNGITFDVGYVIDLPESRQIYLEEMIKFFPDIKSGEELKEKDQKEIAKLNETIDIEVCAKVAIKGWSGVVDSDTGREIKFSEDMARDIMKKYPKLRSEILEVASDPKNFGVLSDSQKKS